MIRIDAWASSLPLSTGRFNLSESAKKIKIGNVMEDIINHIKKSYKEDVK